MEKNQKEEKTKTFKIHGHRVIFTACPENYLYKFQAKAHTEFDKKNYYHRIVKEEKDGVIFYRVYRRRKYN